ncbi:hypothetical protein [Halobellus rubicundus]|uniref:Uncharacterized protein n=1 Tax=Halobellus rubicundus TaxID=2996466 RepID=A0ABD5MCW1_9EURY
MGGSTLRQSGRTALVIAFCLFLTTSPVAGIGQFSDAGQQSALTASASGGSVQADLVDVNASELPGSGTEEDPYEISNASELQAMEDDLDAHYELVSDVNASNTSVWNGRSGFDPIGNDSQAFGGTLDGNGYEIDQLYINRSSTNRVGLFGRTNAATVRDISLTEVNVTGHKYVGALIGYSYQSAVQEVSTIGQVSGNENVGGVAGMNIETTIRSVSTNVEVNGSTSIGGLVGHNSNGTIRATSAMGSVNGSTDIGGLVGYNFEGTIAKASARGNVTGSVNVGGLVGENEATIRNASAFGDVAGSVKVGGLVGVNFGTIRETMAVGFVTDSDIVGGLVGINDGGIITDSYWSVNTTGQTNSDGGTPLKTAEMTGEAARTNMQGLAFGTVWMIQPRDYPTPAWQTTDQGGSAPGGGGSAYGSGIAPFTDTVRLSSPRVSSSLAGRISVESSVASETSVELLREGSTNYSIAITAPETAENVTFYIQERAISASQDVENLTMYLDGDQRAFDVGEDAGPGNSSWVAFNIPHFSTRTVSFTAESDIVVDADGGANYTSIQAGVDNATEGEIVEVRPGTYYEEVTVDKNISVVAPQGATLNGTPIGTIRFGITIPEESAVSPTIDGFTISNYSQAIKVSYTTGSIYLRNISIPEGDGIEARNSRGTLQLHNIHINSSIRTGIYAVDSAANWTVQDVIIRSYGNNGIRSDDSTGVWAIQDTTFTNSTAIYADSSASDWYLKNVTLREGSEINGDSASGNWSIQSTEFLDGSTLDGRFSDGRWLLSDVRMSGLNGDIAISGYDSNANWLLHNVTSGPINADYSGGNWSVSESTIQNGRDGLSTAQSSSRWKIYRTVVRNNTYGIWGNVSGNWEIYQSQIVNNSEAGVFVTGSGTLRIAQSVVVQGSATDIETYGSPEPWVNATYNWWGDPAVDGADCIGNVTCANPLSVPPTRIGGVISAESGTSLIGDRVVAYTGNVERGTDLFEAQISDDGQFRIETDHPGVNHTLVYGDDDAGVTFNRVPDFYAIGNVTPPVAVNATLPTAHNVSIQVTDQYGNSIENADVVIEHRNDGAVLREGERDATNESGYLSIDGATTFELVGNLTIDAALGGVGGSTNIQVDSDRTVTVELSGADVTGNLSASGGSVASDRVGIFRLTDDSEVEGVETIVDESGQFSVGAASAEQNYTLAFGDEDAGDISNDVPDLYAVRRVSPPVDVGNVTIPEAYSVSVRVVDRNGEPIQGADIAISHKNGDAVVEEGERNVTNETGYLSSAASAPLELVGNVTVWANYNGVNNSTTLQIDDTKGDRSVVIALTRPDVSGTLSAESGASLEDDTIGLFRQTDGGDIEGVDSTVGADGNFTISGGSADETYTLAFGDDDPGAPNGVPDLYAIQRVSPPADVGDITIPNAYNVSVQVVGPNGEPIPDADAAITHTNGDAIIEEGERDATNETGYVTDGEYTTFEFVGNITVYARFRGISNSTNATVTDDRTGNERIVVELPGYEVNGTVTDADGDAVPNSSVVYDGTDGGDEALWTRSVTDESGRYRTQLFPEGYQVRFRQDSENITFPIDGVPDIYGVGGVPIDGSTRNDISLPRGNRLQIQVTNGTAPLADATVEIVHRNPNGGVSGVEAQTNETGWVQLGGTSGVEVNGTIDVELDSRSYYAERSTIVDSNDSIVLEAEKLINVTGQVINASGDSVTDGEVFARSREGAINDESPIVDNGEYELTLAPNSTYELGFRQDGEGTDVDFPQDGVPDVQSLTVIQTEATDKQVAEQQLGVGHPFDITVKNPDGTNASDIPVYVSDNDVEENFALGVAGETNENGSFVFDGADEPGIEVNGSIDVYVDVPDDSGLSDANRRNIVVDEPGNVTIQLAEALRVNGTIRQPDGVTPAGDERIQVVAAEQDRSAGATVHTDETGFFDAQVPAEGAYHLGFVQADEGSPARLPYPRDGVPDFYAISTVTSGAEGDLGNVTLPEPHNLTVNVVGPNDDLVENATVRLWSTANDAYQWGGETVVDDGSFTVEVNGSVDIRAAAPDEADLRTETERIEVTSDDTVNITLNRNVTVFGSVDYRNGNDTAGYTMELFGDGGDHRLTNETGHFELYPEPNQFYALAFKQTDWEDGRANFPKDGRPDLHTFGVTEVQDEDRSVGDLTLPQAHLVNITVETSDGEPVADAAVDLNTYSGPASAHHPGTTNDDGEVILNGSNSPGIEVNGTLRIGVGETDEYAWNATRIDVSEKRNVTLVVRDRVNVTGRLANESGAALTDFDVFVGRSQAGFPTGQTNDTGWFTVGVGANQSHSLTVIQRDSETGEVAPRDGVTDFYELPTVDVDTEDRNLQTQTVPDSHGILHVSVENESGDPVGDALVTIFANQSGTPGVESARLGSLTDEQGYFTAGDHRGIEAAGNYTIRVERPPNADQYVDETYIREVNVTEEGGDETVVVTLNETDATEPKSDISITDVSLRETEVTAGDPISVDVELNNQGGAVGTTTVELTSVDGTISVSENVEVESGSTATTTLRTTVETAGAYDLTLSAAGDSVWDGSVTVVPKPANVTLVDADVSPKNVTVGESVYVNVTVQNTGDEPGNIPLRVLANGQQKFGDEVNVSGDSTKTVQLPIGIPFSSAGEYEITVVNQSDRDNSVQAGTVTVIEETTESGTGAPGFGFVPAVVALFGVIFLFRRR